MVTRSVIFFLIGLRIFTRVSLSVTVPTFFVDENALGFRSLIRRGWGGALGPTCWSYGGAACAALKKPFNARGFILVDRVSVGFRLMRAPFLTFCVIRAFGANL